MENKQSSSYLINKFLQEVNKDYDFYTNELPDDFEHIDYLVETYMKKGMKLKGKIDKIIFQRPPHVYIYIILINHGYVFKNKVALCEFFTSLSECIPDDLNKLYIDKRKMEAIKILKSEEVQKYIKLGEIIVTDKDIDDYVKLSKNTLCFVEKHDIIIWKLTNYKFKENKNIIWPKIILQLNNF